MLDGYFVESRGKDGGESRFRISAVQPLSKCSLLSRPGPLHQHHQHPKLDFCIIDSRTKVGYQQH